MYLSTFLIKVISALGFSIENADTIAATLLELLDRTTPQKVEAIKALRAACSKYMQWNWNDSVCYTDDVYNALKKAADMHNKEILGLKECKDIIEFVYLNRKNFR
jgi:hypothetical protein